MASKACADTGPVLHLKEIEAIALLSLFEEVIISPIIREELERHACKRLPSPCIVRMVNNDQVVLLAQKYELDLGEASAIWLCKALNIETLLTDDLSAREVAHDLDIQPVGTLGILLRGFREGYIGKEEIKHLLHQLGNNSSLFITSSLLAYAFSEIEKFEKQKKK